MLKLRGPQLGALRRAQEQVFVDEMVEHLREHFPEAVAAMDRTELEGRIRQGTDRAASLGLTTRRDVARLLNLRVLLGWDLEASEPGIMEMLCDERIPDASARLDRALKDTIRRLELEENNARLRRKFA